jgi:putative Mg2+ transporter-C (MgtC) family protein
MRILFSAFLGGLIGMEREIHGRAAGLRTHILVCMGSTLFMITSIVVDIKYGQAGSVDASRIAAGVVTGIGFLGAGAIIRYGTSIRGLTTAASIWAMAAIGLAAGAGMYAAAGITAVIALLVLILSRLEERMALKQPGKKLTFNLREDNGISEDDVRNIIEAYGGRIKRVTSQKVEKGQKKEVVFYLILPRIYQKDVIDEIASIPGVDNVSW